MEEEYTIDNYKSGFYTSTEKHSSRKEWSFSAGVQKTQSPNHFNGYDELPTHLTTRYELWFNLGRRFFTIGYQSVRRVNV